MSVASVSLIAIILYLGLTLCLIASMPTPAYGSSSYPIKEEPYVLVINSYVEGERWSSNLLNNMPLPYVRQRLVREGA